MLKSNFLRKVTIGLITLCLLLTGCSKNNNNNSTKSENPAENKLDDKEAKKIVFNLQRIPETIDPSLRADVSGSRVLGPCMEGLVRLGKKPGEVLPGAAESWNLSDDNLTWTFNLRKNAKWSDGTPLTANDFVFGMKRALAPATGAKYSYQLYYVENAKEFNESKIKDFNEVGIKAVDDHTLKIILSAPCTYFLQLLTTSLFFPINENFYNKVGKKFAIKTDKMIYNGPWVLKHWIHGGKFLYEKNPNYWNKEVPNVPNLEFLMVQDFNTAVNMFRNKSLDMTEISGDQLSQFKNSNEIHITPAGVYYLQFNIKNKFFKNEKIRQAVSYAINRDTFCNYIRKDGSEPAYAFIPTGIAGNKGKTFRNEYGLKILKYDPEKAKELLKEGLDEIGFTGKMKVTLLLDNTQTHRKDGQFIQEELHKLGIDVTLEPNTFQSRIAKQHNKNFEFVYGGWLPDYDDPLTYIDLWYSTSGLNNSNWGNPKYDRMVDIAKSSTDNKLRMDSMAEAEKILLDDTPVTPLYFRPIIWLVKSGLEEVVIRPVGLSPEFTYAYWK